MAKKIKKYDNYDEYIASRIEEDFAVRYENEMEEFEIMMDELMEAGDFVIKNKDNEIVFRGNRLDCFTKFVDDLFEEKEKYYIQEIIYLEPDGTMFFGSKFLETV